MDTEHAMRTLRELLAARKGNASLNSFSEKIGLPAPTLSALLTGDRNAGVDTLRKIYRAFPNDNELHTAIVAYVFGNEVAEVPS